MTLSPLTILRLTCTVALLAAFSGCIGKKKEQYAGVDGDYVTGTPLPERQEGVSFLGANVDKSQFQPIYFGYDSAEVSSSEQDKLGQVASFLQSGGKTVIIAGFTDERGTEEYNRGLGERRAQAVRSFLISSGADASTIQTVSFGEEMPTGSGGGDEAWAQNRRAEIGVVK